MPARATKSVLRYVTPSSGPSIFGRDGMVGTGTRVRTRTLVASESTKIRLARATPDKITRVQHAEYIVIIAARDPSTLLYSTLLMSKASN